MTNTDTRFMCGIKGCWSGAVACTDAVLDGKRGEVLLCPEHAWPVRDFPHAPFWLVDLLVSGDARIS